MRLGKIDGMAPLTLAAVNFCICDVATGGENQEEFGSRNERILNSEDGMQAAE